MTYEKAKEITANFFDKLNSIMPKNKKRRILYKSVLISSAMQIIKQDIGITQKPEVVEAFKTTLAILSKVEEKLIADVID